MFVPFLSLSPEYGANLKKILKTRNFGLEITGQK